MKNGLQVYDCFLFYDEFDILEIRLNILNDVVDYFVLVESSRTFSGNKKPLYFSKNKHKFSKYLNKIKHVVIDDEQYNKDLNFWQREFDQRDAILNGLEGCRKEDFVIIADVDEIPSPELVKEIVNQNLNSVAIIKQPCFYYYLNCKSSEVFDKARIAKFKKIKTPQQIRSYPRYNKINSNKSTQIVFKWFGSVRKRLSLLFRFYKIYENAGWHFTYIKKPAQISEKIKDFSHMELDSKEYNDIKLIQARIENLQDPFDRKYELRRVEIDRSFPEYLIKNIDKYSHLILHSENQ